MTLFSYKKSLVTLASLASLALLSSNVLAANAKTELQSLVNKYSAFTANFKQVAKDPKGKVLNSSTGVLKAQKPNSLLLHTIAPNELFLSVVGQEVLNYDPFVEQVTRSNLGNVGTVPFLYLLNSSPKAWESVEVTKDSKGCYYLKDPKISKSYKALKVCVAGSNLQSVIIYEKNGNSNSYYLSGFTPKTLSNADFKINYPEGTQIKDLE